MTMVPTRDQVPRLADTPIRRIAAPATSGGGITPRDLVRIIRKRKWMILLIFLATSAAMFVLTLLWWLYAPQYTADVYLTVQPPNEQLLQAAGTPFPKEIIERFKRSQAAMAKQQTVLDGAASDPRLQQTQWYGRYQANITNELDSEIGLTLVPDTDLIRMSISGTQREDLPIVVNTVAEHFVKFAGRTPRSKYDEQTRKLDAEKTSLQGNLQRFRRDRAALIGSTPLAAMEGRRSLVSIKLQLLTEQVGQAEVIQSQTESALKSVSDAMREGSFSKDPMILQAVEMDRLAAGLTGQVADAKTRLDNLERKFGAQHLGVLQMRSHLESSQTQLEARRKEVIQVQSEGMVQGRQMALGVATAQLADLTQRLNEAKAEARDLEEQLGRIDTLALESKDAEDSIRRIDNRLIDLRLLTRGKPGEELFDLGPVQILAPATLPRRPSWPQWWIMMSIGVLLGLLLGFGLAFILEFADTSVKGPSDLARRVDLPLLGMVPHADDLDEEIPDIRRVVATMPHSPITEAFRRIRTNLLFSGPATQRRSLLITSPSPEDGRTTVVMNMAIAVAQSGRRVLVVDANFRQPAIGLMYPQAPAAGLSSALVGQANWREVVYATDIPNLSVIAAGPLPPNPADLLGSPTMRTLVDEMTAEYDQVLFDGSPVTVVSDAVVLATQIDGVVLVVRAGVNSIGIVQRANEQLTRVGARMLGVVLHGVRSTAGGYLQKSYETFYEYHQKPQTT